MIKTMGLETLLEAAKYLEYRAEVEARGEKGFLPDLPSNGSSPGIITAATISNGFASQPRGIVPNGLHYVSQSHSLPSYKSHLSSSAGPQRVVPEPLNDFKVDHSYRRISSSHSPDFEYNGGTNRMAKSVSPNSISGLNNRNSGTREVHNKLEKNRRAHLKECFELLKSHLPSFEDRKISNLAILRSSLRHIQALKRKERELEHEMERLARDKIALQQRLQLMKKDMAGQWDQLDWRMAPDGVDLDMDGTDCRRSPTSTETTVTLSPDRMLENRYSESSDSSSPTNNMNRSHGRQDMEMDDSESDSQHPLSLTVNNCHITEQKVGRKYGQVNGVNGISGKGPISPITTTKLSSLAALTVCDKLASPHTGGATFLSTMANNNSGRKNGFTVLGNTAILVNSKLDIGQYYEEKMCK